MGVYEILDELYEQRSDLSVSLRNAYTKLIEGRSKSMLRLIIKRDVDRYLVLCSKIDELEQMRDELQSVFGGVNDSNIIRIHGDVWRGECQDRSNSGIQ